MSYSVISTDPSSRVLALPRRQPKSERNVSVISEVRYTWSQASAVKAVAAVVPAKPAPEFGSECCAQVIGDIFGLFAEA
jgi:hypothetical protein